MVNSAEHAVKKLVSWVRILLSGHALSTVDEHKFVSAEPTAEEEAVVLLPGANEAVAAVREVRQVVRLLSVLSPVKNAEQPELTPVGIKGFAVATAVADEVALAVALVAFVLAVA